MTLHLRPRTWSDGVMVMPEHSDIDAYLAAQPEPARSTLQTMRAMVHDLQDDVTEVISYGCPGFRWQGRMIGGFANFGKHCSWFPHSGSVLELLSADIEGYAHTKSSLHFGHDEPLPRDLLGKLIAARVDAIVQTAKG